MIGLGPCPWKADHLNRFTHPPPTRKWWRYLSVQTVERCRTFQNNQRLCVLFVLFQLSTTWLNTTVKRSAPRLLMRQLYSPVCSTCVHTAELLAIFLPRTTQINFIIRNRAIREESQTKMSQKVEKVHNFLDPPPHSPRMFWTFLNLGKIGNLIPPPPWT